MDGNMKCVALIISSWSLLCSLLALSVIADCQRFDNVEEKYGYEQSCNGDTCEKINIDSLVKPYTNVFMTEDEFKQREKKAKENRDSYIQNEGVNNIETINEMVGDGDTCCPTRVLVYKNTTMVNLKGVTRSIIHRSSLDPPQYQFFRHGYCVGNGKCEGKCIIEPITLTVLVFNFDTATPEFDYFEVPGYCSCKNIAL